MIYIHSPFCKKKCIYCDFNSFAKIDYLMEDYVRALIVEISGGDKLPEAIDSIYFGGGNPLLLGAENLKRIMDAIEKRYQLSDSIEISIEANPESISEEILLDLIEARINRISIGFQSTCDSRLKLLNRGHTAADAISAFNSARAAGFTNINIDLIFGIPSQSVEDWKNELEHVVRLEPDHLSIYSLTVEEGTELKNLVESGLILMPDEQSQVEMMEFSHSFLKEGQNRSPYRHYEISNFSKPGFECRHNLNCWQGGSYIGFGAGAHSHVEGRRWWNIKDPFDYVGSVMNDRVRAEGSEVLGLSERLAETLFLGLRLIDGVRIDELDKKFNDDILSRYRQELEELSSHGLVSIGDKLSLTEKGLVFADQVVSSFL